MSPAWQVDSTTVPPGKSHKQSSFLSLNIFYVLMLLFSVLFIPFVAPHFHVASFASCLKDIL